MSLRSPDVIIRHGTNDESFWSQLWHCRQSKQSSLRRSQSTQSADMAFRTLAGRWRAGAAVAAAIAAGGTVAYCEDPKGVGFDPEALERGAKALREINKSPYAKKVCLALMLQHQPDAKRASHCRAMCVVSVVSEVPKLSTANFSRFAIVKLCLCPGLRIDTGARTHQASRS